MVQAQHLLIIVLAACSSVVQGARLAFHFDGLKHAGCKSGTYDVQLNELKFISNQEDNLFRPGDTVIVQGHFRSDKVLPMDMTMRVKACKYFGTLCTQTLGESQNSFGDEWHLYSMYGNGTYPEAGLYGFEKTFTMPSNSVTDWPYAGLTFEMVADMQADDYGNSYTPHLRCHAQFTTVNWDTYRETGQTGSGFSSGFGKWSMLGLVGLVGGYAGFMARKRRLAQPSIPNLNGSGSDEATATNFEMMDFENGAACDADSVRV